MPPVSKQIPPNATQRQTPTSRSEVISRIGPVGYSEEDGIHLLLYGKSGTGKTTLASTFPGKILWIVCSGSQKTGELRSIDTPAMRKKVDQVVLESSAEAVEVVDYLKDSDYATAVLDHASGLQDLTLKEILGLENLPVQKTWGLASQQQYGASTLSSKEILRSLLNLRINVVIIAQERVFNEEGDSDIIQPTVGAALTPSLAGWLNPACDYVCQTFIRPRMEKKTLVVEGKTKERTVRVPGMDYCLRTGPHDVYMTKFRLPKGSHLPEVLTDPDYDKIMSLIRSKRRLEDPKLVRSEK